MKRATFGGRVQERREELHYTQEALAEVMGLSYNFIVALEGDRKKPSIQTFTKLISVLDVSADWLLGIEPSEHRKEREERFKYIDEKNRRSFHHGSGPYSDCGRDHDQL